MMAMNDSDEGARAAALDAILPGRPTATRPRRKRSSLARTLIVPPIDIPNVGRFSVISDPQGAVFAIFKPRITVDR